MLDVTGHALPVLAVGLLLLSPATAGGACSEFLPLAPEEELAKTPRADVDVEQVAVFLDLDFVATDATYQRLITDLQALRGLDPLASPLEVRPPIPPRSMLVSFEDVAWPLVQAGTFDGWDCANAAYRLSHVRLLSSSHAATLGFEGVYHTPRLARQYESIPGIDAAVSDSFGGDGPGIWIGRSAQTFHYFVREASGDCPSGCIHEYIRYYRSTAPGALRFIGDSNEADAAWLETYREVRQGNLLIRSTPADIPALSHLGLCALALSVLGLGIRFLRRDADQRIDTSASR